MPTAELRFLIELAPQDRRRLREIRAGVAAELGPGWPVTHLFRPPRIADLGRYLVTTGQVPASPAYPLSALGYDMARGLSDRLHAQVEPDLPSSAYHQDGTTDLPGPRAAVADHPPGVEDGLAAAAVSVNDRHWSVENVRAPQAWATAPRPGGVARGAGIRIGHVDTGYTDHPEIFPAALDLTIDRDVLDGDDDAKDPLIKRWWFPLDTPGHGTGTGCVIGSRQAGEVAGTAPEALLVPIRSIISVVQVFDSDIARAVDYARSAGCRVISMSLGGRGFNGLQAAIRRAVDEGVIVMAAAGNYVGFVTAPASYPECLAVAATTFGDQPWSGSSRGAQVDIAAPGQRVWTAVTRKGPDGPVFSVEQGDGTSFAVAALAGIAALWLAHHGADAVTARYRGRTQEVFRRLVTQTCRIPPGWDNTRYGAGIVDAKALLDAALPDPQALPLAAAVGIAQGPLEQLAATWPDRSLEQIQQSLSATLGGLAAANGPDPIARYAGEIRYLAGEDPMLHRRLVPPTGAPAPADEPPAPDRAAIQVAGRVRSGMSRELAQAIEQ